MSSCRVVMRMRNSERREVWVAARDCWVVVEGEVPVRKDFCAVWSVVRCVVRVVRDVERWWVWVEREEDVGGLLGVC